jgi:predicted signal transduction protein with EAL and GGDEF domain
MRVADTPSLPTSEPSEVASAGASQRYAALAESTDGAIIIRSLDGTILSWDATAERMYGFFTVAEGVETAEQLATLRTMGCRAAQGFYVSEPVTGSAFPSIVFRYSSADADARRPGLGIGPCAGDTSPAPALDVRAAGTSPKSEAADLVRVMPTSVLDATRALL